MFDLNDEQNTRVKRRSDPFTDEFDLLEDDDAPDHPMDETEVYDQYRQLLSYYRQELDRQYENRIQQAIDEDFYDHEQWNPEDAAALRERGQAPLVFNVIAQSINWIIGSEKRGRVDFKILPRGKEDTKPAEKKTSLLKYFSDVNRTPFHRSRAFEDATKVGIGWLEDGAQTDDEGEPIYSRYESWRNMLWDSASTEYDLDDCRWVSRTKWVDLDIAIAMFPDREDLLRKSAADSSAHGTDGLGRDADEVMDSHELELDATMDGMVTPGFHRQRVRLIEMWFRKPGRVRKIVAGEFLGEEYDPANPDQEEAVQGGYSVVAEKLDMVMHYAIMTPLGMLHTDRSPYRHNRFPFTPVWGYRRGRDHMPYGVIRGLRDLQEDINKRASKALYIISSNKVLMEEGAVEDIEEFREEASRPDAILVYKRNHQIELNADRGLEQSHLDLMARDINMIQQVSGVTDELMGRTTNATSGVAVEARQNQGMMSTAKMFDNLRLATQMQGELQLSLTEQYVTEEKSFRITNDRGVPDWQTVNDGLPENDIIRTKADFIVSEDEWRATLRQAQAEQLMEMMTRMPPEVSMVMMDLVVEAMDIPNREDIVKRIRQINGMRDPDATEPTPEEQARAAKQAEQEQMQKAIVEAEIRSKLASAGVDEVEARKKAAELAETNMDTQKAAIEAAVEALASPQVIRMADRLLREGGFMSRTELEAINAAQQAEQMRARQMQMAQAAQQQQPAQAPQQQGLPTPQQVA